MNSRNARKIITAAMATAVVLAGAALPAPSFAQSLPGGGFICQIYPQLCAPQPPRPKPPCIRDIVRTVPFAVGTPDKVSANGDATAEIHFTDTSRASKLEARVLRACFGGRCTTAPEVAKLLVDGRSGGGSTARLFLFGTERFSRSLVGRGYLYQGELKATRTVSGELVLIPSILNAAASATVEGGVYADLTFGIQPLPPEADLTGMAKAWAFGEGNVSLRLIPIGPISVGEGRLNMRLDAPNPVLTATLRTGVCFDPSLSANFTATAYQLNLNATVRVGLCPFFCATKTFPLLNQTGPSVNIKLI